MSDTNVSGTNLQFKQDWLLPCCWPFSEPLEWTGFTLANRVGFQLITRGLRNLVLMRYPIATGSYKIKPTHKK